MCDGGIDLFCFVRKLSNYSLTILKKGRLVLKKMKAMLIYSWILRCLYL